MGFFSWNCKGCEESIKAPYDIPENIKWQNDCVVIMEDESFVTGCYDGYGRIDDFEIMEESEPSLWHKRCWEKAGKPKYTGASNHAADQGFFYDYPTKANMPISEYEPFTQEELSARDTYEKHP
jgi:hypothetical protein